MADLILIRGLPGSGKSTLAKKLAGYTHIEPDMYHITVSGDYDWVAERVPAARRWTYNTVRFLLQGGQNVVLSEVFNTSKSVRRYKSLALTLGATFTVIEVAGGFQNIHNVPEETLKAMADNWEELSL